MFGFYLYFLHTFKICSLLFYRALVPFVGLQQRLQVLQLWKELDERQNEFILSYIEVDNAWPEKLMEKGVAQGNEESKENWQAGDGRCQR